MKRITLIVGLVILMMIAGCQQVDGRKEADGSITFKPGKFEPWTNGYEAGITIMIEPVK